VNTGGVTRLLRGVADELEARVRDAEKLRHMQIELDQLVAAVCGEPRRTSDRIIRRYQRIRAEWRRGLSAEKGGHGRARKRG